MKAYVIAAEAVNDQGLSEVYREAWCGSDEHKKIIAPRHHGSVGNLALVDGAVDCPTSGERRAPQRNNSALFHRLRDANFSFALQCRRPWRLGQTI
jgi:hypothetical protein